MFQFNESDWIVGKIYFIDTKYFRQETNILILLSEYIDRWVTWCVLLFRSYLIYRVITVKYFLKINLGTLLQYWIWLDWFKKNHDLILLCFYSVIILGICGEDNNLPSLSYWSDGTVLVFLYTKIRNSSQWKFIFQSLRMFYFWPLL